MSLRWPLNVPVLSDGQVTLRAHVRQDIDDMLAMAQGPDMARWTSVPAPHRRADSERFAFEFIPEGWDSQQHREWAIEATDDLGRRRYAGNIALRDSLIGDLGFALHPWARGRGIMTTAVHLAMNWAFTEGGFEAIHWRAQVGNEASLRVAHSTGFELIGVSPALLNQRGEPRDAWTGVFRFGDAPIAKTPWAEATVLETPLLRLRPLSQGDLDRIVEACSDPQTRHWLAGLPTPYRRSHAASYLAGAVWQAALGNEVIWAIADRDSDVLLGNISVTGLRQAYPGGGEIGYWMHPDARGRGFATEAVGLVCRHFFQRPDLYGKRHRLLLRAVTENHASRSIALANGFEHVGHEQSAEPLGDGTWGDLERYELLSPPVDQRPSLMAR